MNTPVTFSSAIRRQPADMLRATLLIAHEVAYPELDVEDELEQFLVLVEQADEAVPTKGDVLTRAKALSAFMFDDLGFAGNRLAYYDPRNSFLNEVLGRRLGIPITLSILYVEVAQRLGIPATGVGMPGHFIVRIDTPTDEGSRQPRWLDPFNGGSLLHRADCERLVKHTSNLDQPFDDRWLLPISTKDTLTRLLNNLRLIYMHREQWPQALKVIQRMRLLHPKSALYWRDLGVVYYELGKPHLAAHALNEYMHRNLNVTEDEHIQKNLRLLLNQITPLN